MIWSSLSTLILILCWFFGWVRGQCKRSQESWVAARNAVYVLCQRWRGRIYRWCHAGHESSDRRVLDCVCGLWAPRILTYHDVDPWRCRWVCDLGRQRVVCGFFWFDADQVSCMSNWSIYRDQIFCLFFVWFLGHELRHAYCVWQYDGSNEVQNLTADVRDCCIVWRVGMIVGLCTRSGQHEAEWVDIEGRLFVFEVFLFIRFGLLCLGG